MEIIWLSLVLFWCLLHFPKILLSYLVYSAIDQFWYNVYFYIICAAFFICYYLINMKLDAFALHMWSGNTKDPNLSPMAEDTIT